MRSCCRMFLALVALLLGAGLAAAQPQGRVAPVIGNSSYRHAPALANPDRDMIASALTGIGFDVTLMKDLDRRGMMAALRDFGTKAARAEVALVFYVGHGVQVGRANSSESDLVPTDARLLDVRDVDEEAVSLNRVLERLEGARPRVVILDARRDNPMAAQMQGLAGTRTVSRGLGRVDVASRGTLVVF